MGNSFFCAVSHYCELDEESEPAEHRERCDEAFARWCKRKASLLLWCAVVGSRDIWILHSSSPFVSFFAV